MPWNTLRQSLNLLSRRGVFEDRGVVRNLAVKLADKENVTHYNAFPFELLATWKAMRDNVPVEISNALQEAMEIATRNVPTLPGDTLIAVDMSGSMCGAPVTGRGNKPSIISVVECASLIACSLLRQNKTASLIGFDSERYPSYRSVGQSSGLPGVYVMSHLNPFDSVMTNVNKMNHSGGGTDISLPFRYLLGQHQKVDNIILLSDYESWTSPYAGGKGAPTCAAWMTYAAKHKNAKLACVDLQPQNTTQVPDQPGRVINIGGWNDPMFRVLGDFFTRDTNISFVQIIEASVDV
jgi:60 kDa SS-A/Ro ribonucleoprotein